MPILPLEEYMSPKLILEEPQFSDSSHYIENIKKNIRKFTYSS